MVIAQDGYEERRVRVSDYKSKNFPNHPILFNLHLDGSKSGSVIGLSYKEAKSTIKEISKALRRMMKNENKT